MAGSFHAHADHCFSSLGFCFALKERLIFLISFEKRGFRSSLRPRILYFIPTILFGISLFGTRRMFQVWTWKCLRPRLSVRKSFLFADPGRRAAHNRHRNFIKENPRFIFARDGQTSFLIKFWANKKIWQNKNFWEESSITRQVGDCKGSGSQVSKRPFRTHTKVTAPKLGIPISGENFARLHASRCSQSATFVGVMWIASRVVS